MYEPIEEDGLFVYSRWDSDNISLPQNDHIKKHLKKLYDEAKEKEHGSGPQHSSSD